MLTGGIAIDELERVHVEFSNQLGTVLSEMLDDDVRVSVIEHGERSLAAHYQSLTDPRYIFFCEPNRCVWMRPSRSTSE